MGKVSVFFVHFTAEHADLYMYFKLHFLTEDSCLLKGSIEKWHVFS